MGFGCPPVMPPPEPLVPTISIGNIIVCVPSVPRTFSFICAGWMSLVRLFFSLGLMFSVIIPLRQQQTGVHSGSQRYDSAVVLLGHYQNIAADHFGVGQKRPPMFNCRESYCSEMLASSRRRQPFPASQPGGDVCYHLRVSNVCLDIPGIA